MELWNRSDAGTYKQLIAFNAPFGCEAANLKQSKLKGEYPGERCINLGRADRSTCWLLYSLVTNKYVRSVNVAMNSSC